jgi:aminoglycoside 2'-N-acetyltransferase I
MVDLVTYADEALPEHLKCQILSFHRIQWPTGYTGQNQLRTWIQRPWYHPVHIALVHDDLLISYAGVVWKHLDHAGEVYKTFGLSGVFTYPAFRRQGYGRRVVDAGTAYIQRAEPDIGLFTCAPRLIPFYAAGGWEWVPNAVLLGGPPGNPEPSDEETMMRFFSEQGVRGRAAFASIPISFDDDLW